MVAFSFDEGIATDAFGNRYVVDTGGERRGYAVGPSPDHLKAVRRGAGMALKFPEPCAAAPGSTCPRVIVDVAHDAALNPGTRDLLFGVSVLVGPGEVGPSSNIVQKGFGVGVAPDPNQWKIELTGPAGRPSCVVVDKGTGKAFRAAASVSVADGTWHAIRCIRAGTSLTIQVDGVHRGVAVLPAGASVENEDALRIGGNAKGQNNDQFFGALDDVFFNVR